MLPMVNTQHCTLLPGAGSLTCTAHTWAAQEPPGVVLLLLLLEVVG